MYKKLILALLFPVSLLAQDNIAADKKHEIGINATMLVKQLVALSNINPPTLPYALTYKYITGKNALRFGIGASVTRDKSKSRAFSAPLQNYPSVPTYINKTIADIRLGYEIQFPVEKRFIGYLGADIVATYDREKSYSITISDNLPSYYTYNKSTVNNTTFRVGGGPVAGFQFFLTSRLSLFTEVPLYFTWGKTAVNTNSITDSYFGQGLSTSQISDSSSISSTRLNITLPVTLYLAMRF
jgi:hypothetical protein